MGHIKYLIILLSLVLAITSATLQKNNYIDTLSELEEEGLGPQPVFQEKDSSSATSRDVPKFHFYDSDSQPSFSSHLSAEQNCSIFTQCFTCLSSISCGWCSGLNKCLAATTSTYELQSDDATCNATLGWHVHVQDCRNCSIYTDCASCVKAYNNTLHPTNSTHNSTVGWNGCGWCGNDKTGSGNCFDGTVQGPFKLGLKCLSVSQVTHNTTNGSWRFDAKHCPSNNDSEKRKLAIIIGLSVAGGLFVLAVIATIVFIIVKRYRHKYSEYGPINDDVA